MLVETTHFDDKQWILCMKQKLKKIRNSEGGKIYINSQQPEAFREEKRWMKQMQYENDKKNLQIDQRWR